MSPVLGGRGITPWPPQSALAPKEGKGCVSPVSKMRKSRSAEAKRDRFRVSIRGTGEP